MAKWICGSCAARMTVRHDLIGTVQKCLKCGLSSEVTDEIAPPSNLMPPVAPEIPPSNVVIRESPQSPLVLLLLAAILITLIVGIAAYAIQLRHQEERRRVAELFKKYDDDREAAIRRGHEELQHKFRLEDIRNGEY